MNKLKGLTDEATKRIGKFMQAQEEPPIGPAPEGGKMKLKKLSNKAIAWVVKEIIGTKQAQAMIGEAQVPVDAFTDGYIEAMLWSTSVDEDMQNRIYEETGEVVEFLDSAFEDIPAETVEKAKADCERFQMENKELLDQVSEQFGVSDDQHGHDFWLTRAGHGVGFWDHGYGELGEKLTEAAEAYGEQWPYLGDDRNVYIDQEKQDEQT